MMPASAKMSERANRYGSQSLGFMVGAGLSLVLALCLVIATFGRGEGNTIKLTGRVNPNTASPASLARLPGIGLTRAQAIVAYRARIREETGREAIFGCPEDLRAIAGIGPKTVDNMASWLEFDQPEPNVAGQNDR
jgi:competence ComEA-like helix-hairpin-helix protein